MPEDEGNKAEMCDELPAFAGILPAWRTRLLQASISCSGSVDSKL